MIPPSSAQIFSGDSTRCCPRCKASPSFSCTVRRSPSLSLVCYSRPPTHTDCTNVNCDALVSMLEDPETLFRGLRGLCLTNCQCEEGANSLFFRNPEAVPRLSFVIIPGSSCSLFAAFFFLLLRPDPWQTWAWMCRLGRGVLHGRPSALRDHLSEREQPMDGSLSPAPRLLPRAWARARARAGVRTMAGRTAAKVSRMSERRGPPFP